MSVDLQLTRDEGKKVPGGTEYLIYCSSVPEWQRSQTLGTRLGNNLLKEGVRNTVNCITMFRYPRQIDGKPVRIGSFKIANPKTHRVPEDTGFEEVRVEIARIEAENAAIVSAHALKVETALRIIDASLEEADMTPSGSRSRQGRTARIRGVAYGTA